MKAAERRCVSELTRERLDGMCRGLEKESLRASFSGQLALTPHPVGLGSPLTHPSITTDFSESQLELITAPHADAEACLQELERLHAFVYRVLAETGQELLWVGSMPCALPNDEAIPIAYFGTSNIGRLKSVYRMGLAHRYGRRMQTISGIHYNWSLPGLGNEDYFAIIRNFRRGAALLLYLFGASPAVCASFVEGRAHRLEPLAPGTLFLPWATSLRMGRLGYQSEAQAQLAVSYNSLEDYAASLYEALTRPYPPYEAIGLRGLGGDYNQLNTTLLQIENEFYGLIRPKRRIRPGERPLHALRERGVEYLEVRLIDLDPFLPLGIDADGMRFLDLFLLDCWLEPSPADTPEEIAALAENQQRVSARGREPGLRILDVGANLAERAFSDWAQERLARLEPLAAHLDAGLGFAADGYRAALAWAQARIEDPQRLPSARVLAMMRERFAGSYLAFFCARSREVRESMLAKPLDQAERVKFDALARTSLEKQRALEAADAGPGGIPFEVFRAAYVSPERLIPTRSAEVQALALSAP
ncbi:MAG: glutamate--cysteine ligase [Burkholderiales bacterium]|nr:glutamate--cysteine ligase [Burkholderiales bacterium]